MEHPAYAARPVAALHDARFDAIRVAACLAVVMLHISARPLYLHIQGSASHGWWLIGNFVSSLTHWCVPVFVMLSGALLLGRDLSWRETYLKRIPRVALVLAVAIGIYALWRIYFVKDFTPAGFMRDILQGQPYYHLYFFYVIIGLYAIAPVLAGLFRQVDEVTARSGVMAACIISFAVLTFGVFRGTYARDAVGFAWDYIGYFCLGFYLVRYQPKLPYLMIAVGAYLLTVASVEVSALTLGPGSAWTFYSFLYFAPTVYAFSIGVFGSILNLQIGDRAAHIVKILAPLTLIVYIIHPMIMESLRWAFAVHVPMLARLTFDLPVTFALTVSMSFAAAWLLRQVPLVRRYF